ncbi:MAG: DUF4145 domain-containing protein [Candidatus Obscuribacter sp.]|nr:DUF4145 domain-containing protein [Candidatus Obscuribacter sp.]
MGIFGFVGGIVSQSEIALEDPSRAGCNTLFHGTRQCPNTECGCIVTFWSFANDEASLVTWPSARAAFDKTLVPTKAVDAFREALECEAKGLYVSSAITLRKTMEEICCEQNAAGPNLKERIDALLAQETFQANYATHCMKFATWAMMQPIWSQPLSKKLEEMNATSQSR